MTGKMKTVCVGRFLIDLPADAQIEVARPNIHGFDIAVFSEGEAEFQARVAHREAELKAKPDQSGGARNLESATDVRTENGVAGKVFVHNRTVSEGTRARGLEIERYRNEGISVEALVHAGGLSIDMAAEYYDPDKLANLPQLVSQLVPNPENQIPGEPGFCIDRAYFRDPLTADQGEQIMMFARLPSHPDIEFMLILAAGQKPDDETLLERGAAAEASLSLLERMRLSTLRAAPRVIAGLPGEELVRLGVEENDAHVYSFWWEVNGTEDDVLVPHLVFQMNTGQGKDGPVPTSISEDAAMALWDQVSDSIRIRPAAQDPIGRVEAQTVPIGTYAWADEHCPESGWWLCCEGGNGIGVLGGQRQYIRKGERMPQALLLLPQTIWDKMRGLQPNMESKGRTSWKLVDHRARKRTPPGLPLANAALPPGAMVSIARSESAEETVVPVGSYSSTGLPCPASGWWRCEESHALDGTRWFARGSLLPPATFTVAPGVFGRSANGPKAIQRRSAWRLMRVADAPPNVGGDSGSYMASVQSLPPPAQQS
ncbi:MAG: T6SS immunity protein Tli4 family protein [Pseudomonadota bacterium]